MFRRLLSLLPLVLAFALAPAALAGGPSLQLGAAEDVVRAPDLPTAKAKMTLLKLAGFSSVRVTSQWQGTETAPSTAEITTLKNVAAAAQLSAVRVYLSVYPTGSRVTPLTPEARELFAAYLTSLKQQLPSVKDVIVGNEPNLNRFWLPQFNPDGTDAAAPAYLALLARSYDAIKAVDPATRVWGGALAPRGVDRPGTGRDTHSPVAFLKDMGVAYRASGRTLPVMDGLTFHPYADTSGQSPDTPHPNSTTIGIADYDRLMRTLATAFDSSPQAGSLLPILYDEFGVESKIPAGKASAYTGSEPATTNPVDETTQAAYYQRALQLAFCQPNVTGIFFFHSQDEPALANWQSGLYYADGTPKSSLYAVRDALARARGGSIARCDGLGLDVNATKVRFPTQAELGRGMRDLQFTCTLDCMWELRVSAASSGVTRVRLTGYGRAGTPVAVSLKGRKLGSGPVKFSITLTQPVNPGVPQTRESSTLSLR
jgi:hypothetical protein